MTVRVGETYAHLTVIGDAVKVRRHWQVECRCTCGETVSVDRDNLRRGNTKSCGCQRYAKPGYMTHGHSKRTAEYVVWKAMRQRCMNPASPAFPRYGGRGIKVCARWDDFANFFADMGPRPEGQTIERINNDGDYSPNNCRWATRAEQCNNRSTCTPLEHAGETLTISEWSRRLGMNSRTVWYRLKRGWSVERTLTEPIQLTGRWPR